jgi:hypothetical protein
MIKRRTPIQKTPQDREGQSLVELALFLPVLLIIVTGLTEFGFMMNQYMNLLDGPRESARLAADYPDPFLPANVDSFYLNVAQESITTISPIVMDARTDDIVISIFKMTGKTVTERYTSGLTSGFGTSGQWSLQKYCQTHPSGTSGTKYSVGAGGIDCSSATIPSFHASKFPDNASIEALLASMPEAPPNGGVVLVELFYDYDMLLKLPWITFFVSNPVELNTYTAMPMPAAEPH